MNEWPLLIFTVLLQAAIGGTVMLAIFYKQIEKLGKEKAFQVLRMPLVAIAAFSIVGLAAAFAHLGSPGNALNTIRNLATSWQSREILLTGLFIGIVVLTVALAFAQKKANIWLIGLSAVVGLITVYSMGAIYANTLVSGWNSVNTYLSFYGTAFVLGPVLVVSCMVPVIKNESDEWLHSIMKNSFIIAVFGIALQLVGTAVFATSMPEVNMIAGTNALTVLEAYSGTVAVRWMIEIAGIAVLGYLAFAKSRKSSLYIGYAALVALFVAEGMSRYVFYILGA